MRLEEQGDIELIPKAIDYRFGWPLAAIVDHDHLEVVPRILESRQGPKTAGQLVRTPIGWNDYREDLVLLYHQAPAPGWIIRDE
jgi:hypothetical protein